MIAPLPTATPIDQASILATYVPRLIEDHHRRGGADRLLFATGTLVSADISGFTALSERLAALGHEGAEQLTDLLNRCFTEMIAACEHRGGDIVKFGGDALLVLFTGEEHAQDAAVAMSRMHAIVSGSWSTESVRRISLGISQGAHSGTIGFSIADAGHLELLVGGPAVSTTVTCEGDAGRGEILVSPATAELLPDDWLGRAQPTGARTLLHRRVHRSTADLVPTTLPHRGTPGLELYLPGALAEQLVAGVPGEHRQVVVAFVTLGGTDDLFARDGAEAVHAACEAFGRNVRSVLQQHAVHVLASDAYVNGTKLILTAGAPSSTDADDDHMLLALRDLFDLESPLPVRAGVNRGHVFVGDLGGPTRRTFTVMGDAVNLAARLMQRAEPGQVVVADAVLDRATTVFAVESLEPFTVKGKTAPIDAAILGAPRSDVAEEHISHIGFVGRVDELAELDRLAHAAHAGNGCLVEVVGEPGIGKSRLVRETLQRHPEFPLHRIRGGHYARHTPFFAVRRLLHSLLELGGSDPELRGRQLVEWCETRAPKLADWLPLLAIVVDADVEMTSAVRRLAEQFRRDRLLAVTADAIDIALRSPVAILGEDVHLFDTGSTDVLALLAQRSGDRPWFIVTTRRADTGVTHPSASLIELDTLGHDEVAELAATAGEMAGFDAAGRTGSNLEDLAARAGGNPLFLLELISATRDAGADALPESVESLITTRIDLLPAPDRTLLREAAVAGNTVDAAILASAFERSELSDDRRWNSLESFLVRDGPGVYRFRHGIYRDVAYAGLSYRRRRESHLAIAGVLERERADNLAATAPLLSDHFERGRDRSRAWKYSVLAGDTARGAYANNEAITLYERALRNADDAHDSAQHGRVAEALGDVHELSGHYLDAVVAYQRSRGLARADAETEVRLLRKIGSVRIREGRLSQSLSWLTRARGELGGIDDPTTRRQEEAETALTRAGALHRQGRNRLCAQWAETAAGAAEIAGDRLVMARAFNMLELAYRTLGSPDAPPYSDRALEMYAGSGDLVGEANVYNNRGVRHHFDGDWPQAIADYEQSRVLREQAGDVVGEAIVANNIAEILCLQGRFDEAKGIFADARSSWEAAGYLIGVAYATANFAMVLARSGGVAAALDQLDDATSTMEAIGASALTLEIAVRRTECLLLAGEPAQALTCATGAIAHLEQLHDGDEQILVQLLPLLGLARARTGDTERAAKTLDEAVARARGQHDPYNEALGLLARAEFADLHGRESGDDRDVAVDLLDKLGVEQLPPVVLG